MNAHTQRLFFHRSEKKELGELMECYDDVKSFIDYTLDEDAEGFNAELPFGGIQDDSPDDVKKAYDNYVKRKLAMDRKGIK